ncbi:MAG: glycosyltransferase family 4 protein [Phycisphaerae bacterium]|jgi:glycosyltransferase involved in cell wall biosynthesis
MQFLNLDVVHVIARDTPQARLETLAALRARSDLVAAQRLVWFGRGGPTAAGLTPDARIAAPLGVGWLARSPAAVVRAERATILHLWSADALAWCASHMPAMRRWTTELHPAAIRVLADFDVSFDRRRLAQALDTALEIHFVTPTLIARRNLIAAGVPPQRCALVRDAVDFSALSAADRRRTRARLGLAEDEIAAVALAPLTRAGGAFYGAWGAMLAHKIQPQLRFVLCGGGHEARRTEELVRAARHADMAIFLRGGFTTPELAAAADVVLFTPVEDVPLQSLAWAMAAGKPIVAAANPATTELLVHGRNAWLAKPGDPKDICRRILGAIERPNESRTHAQNAGWQAFGLFSRQRQAQQFRRVYSNLLNGEEVGQGLMDPAA